MSSPEWKFTETMQTRIRVNKVNQAQRHLDAQDIDQKLPFTLDSDPGLDLSKIKKAKIYNATIKVYTAELAGDFERHLNELAMTDDRLRRSLQVIKRTGSVLKKFELVAIK
jgi:hypothetical protein